MVRQKQSRGGCVYCNREMTKGGLSKHLRACVDRQKKIDQEARRRTKEQTLYHLTVWDAWKNQFWLHLEIPSSAELIVLDDYLRTIWLECCGHLSQFSVGGWSGEELPMNSRLDQIFVPNLVLTHIYDFGSSSETLISVVSERTGRPVKQRPITLMARNNLPQEKCIECKKPAQWQCEECVYEYDRLGFLCDKHMKVHPHEDYGDPKLIINSPRFGVCGYTGPAAPPY
jgi:hypothetical protein